MHHVTEQLPLTAKTLKSYIPQDRLQYLADPLCCPKIWKNNYIHSSPQGIFDLQDMTHFSRLAVFLELQFRQT